MQEIVTVNSVFYDWGQCYEKQCFVPIFYFESSFFFNASGENISKTITLALDENFGGSCNGKCWYIFLPFGILYGHLVNFVTIWYILWSFGTFFSFWYVVPRKIWQPCCHQAISLITCNDT
jgi:hypothetical protein